MRLSGFAPSTVHQIPYNNAPRQGRQPELGVLEIVTVPAVGLGDLGALVLTGDLQFREVRRRGDDRPARMLGESLAEELACLCEMGELPPASEVGVILTGDLYCEPSLTSRGGSGDVRGTWKAFARYFRFAAGVMGNHDTFEDSATIREGAALRSFPVGHGVHLLDVSTIELGGLRIAGVGGIIGDPKRPRRRSEDDYVDKVGLMLSRRRPDLLVLHESPGFPERGLRGSTRLREVIEARPPSLVVCGHIHWESPFIELSSGVQILNVDARCVVLINQRCERNRGC